jgi:tetratricopeptide (TPR) repeat protein
LEEKEIKPEGLDDTLREIAGRFNDLRQQLQSFSSKDQDVNQLRQQAAAALEAGEFGRAEEFLNKASERDLEVAASLQEVAEQRLISAAASKARNGDLKMTQLAYAEAATYFREAANILPSNAEELRASYLNSAGITLYHAGDYAVAEAPLMQALSIREQVLGPHHPNVAVSLDNLAGLYHHQGKYAEAEPLYQRALAIFEQVLAPHHADVATGLNNLALLYYDQGRYAEAEPLYQRPWRFASRRWGRIIPAWQPAAIVWPCSIAPKATRLKGKSLPVNESVSSEINDSPRASNYVLQ